MKGGFVVKKFCAILLPLVLIFAMAVPAFAAVNVGTASLMDSPIGKAGCVVVENGREYLQTFVVSTLYEHQRTTYDQFVALPDNRKLVVIDGNDLLLIIPSADSVFTGDGDFTKLQFAISFSFANGKFTCRYWNGSTGASMRFSSSAYLVKGSDFAEAMINGTSGFPNADFLKYYQTSEKGVGFRDDLGNTIAPPAATHNLTVHYQYADGTKAAEDIVTPFEAGAAYSVTSPEIAGFTPDQATISGTMPDNDLSVTVTYTKNPELFNLTIHYQYADGTKAAESFTAEYVPTSPYYVTSPTITGFTPDQEFVSGRMSEQDLTVTVMYTKVPDSGGGSGGGSGDSGGGTGGNYNPFEKPELEEWTGINPFEMPKFEEWTGNNPFEAPKLDEWAGNNPFVKPEIGAWQGDNPFVKPEQKALASADIWTWFFG